jgi:uncharacterized protein YndB with AHSA1/START domain
MPELQQIAAQRRIAAPAADIFRVITDPRRHVDIDGSGMLLSAPDARPVERVGDTFEMNMDREPLGDIPIGKYQVLNTVTKFVPDEELAWTIGAAGRTPLGHVYGYRLVPVNAAETEVTSYCDWSAISDKWRERVTWPVVPVSMLEQSLENLNQIMVSVPESGRDG